MKYCQLLLILLFLRGFTGVYAQENGKPFIKNYTSKQYKGHTQNWVIEQDSNGIVYFGNQVGVISYDGSEWRNIPISNNTTVRSMSKSEKGRIYVGAVNELGYLKPNKVGKIEFVSLVSKIDRAYRDFGVVWNSAYFNNHVYFLTDKYLFDFDGESIKVHFSKGENFYSCFATQDAFFVQDFGYGFTTLKNDSLELIPNGDSIKIESVHAVLPINENRIIVATREKGLINVDLLQGSFTIISDRLYKYALENEVYHAVRLKDDKIAIATIQNGILIVDNNGKLVEVINKKSGLIDETVYYLYENNGVLWVALETGISKIEYSRKIQFWDESVGLLGSISDIIRYNNQLFVTTGGGVFKLDTNETLELNTFQKSEIVNTQSWELFQFKDILLIGTGRGLWSYKDGIYKRIFRGGGVFKVFESKVIPNRIYLGMNNKLAYIDYIEKLDSFPTRVEIADLNVEVREIYEKPSGTLWTGLFYSGVAKFEIDKTEDSITYSYKIYKKEEGIPIDREIRLHEFENQLFFSTERDVYVYDSINDRFITDTLFTNIFKTTKGKPVLYSVDKNSNHWINGKYLYKKVNNTYLEDTLLLKRLPDFNTELQYIDDDNNFWIGTSSSLFKVKEGNGPVKVDDYKTLIRKVKTKNDSVLYWGTNGEYKSIKIDHHTNFVSFHFATPFFQKEDEILYSHYLEGYDNKWSDWSSEKKKEFTNLFEGKYTFKVRSKNYLNKISKTDEFTFSILPPFYRTLWAYLAYAIFLMIIISTIVYWRTKKFKHDKIKLERIIHSRTQEVIRQKNELEVTAKKLRDANEELKKLSVIAKKSDNAVAVFDRDGNIEWINEGFTHMYGYTLEQFIKEKGKSILDASDSPNITATIRKCIETKETTIYQYFTLTRQNVGIWAQTTLTPLIDKKGNLTRLIAIDTDITKIKDAESKIENQRDELKMANENKDKFFSIIAHDLRGPLSNIFTLLNIIYNELEMFEPDQLKNLIGQLKETTGNTFNLTENLLDWAHLRRDSIKYNPRYINLKELIQENIELFSSQAQKKSITMVNRLVGVENAFADEEMVKTILRNLMGNAIKFTGKYGKISLSTTIEGEKCWIHINDTGKGMDEWEIEKLFRIDKPHTTLGTNKEKGSGLGLILTKEFIEKNKGEIRVESIKGEGSIFSFSLPLNEL